MRRFAPAERRSFSRLGRCRVFPMVGKMPRRFSNVWKIRPRFFQSLENAVSLCSLISTPAAFSNVVFAVLRKLHPSKPATSSAAPKRRRAIRPECAPTVQTSRPFAFSAARPAGRSSRFSRPAPCGLTQACPLWGRCAPRSGFAGFTPRASVTPRRDAVSCRLLCAPFTGCGRNMPASAGKEVGRLRTCFVFHLGRS